MKYGINYFLENMKIDPTLVCTTWGEKHEIMWFGHVSLFTNSKRIMMNIFFCVKFEK
jgi:hypothetical protein